MGRIRSIPASGWILLSWIASAWGASWWIMTARSSLPCWRRSSGRAPKRDIMSSGTKTYSEGVKTYRYDWHRIRTEYRDLVTGKKKAKKAKLRELVERWKYAQDGDRFYGCSSETMLKYLAQGFELEQMRGDAAPRTDAPSPEWRFNDVEGEYDHDLFMSGEPDYYLDAEIEDIPVGVRLAVGYGFNAGTNAQVIAEYASWIGAVIRSLEHRGFNLEIVLEYQGADRYEGSYGAVNHQIVVSKFGEINLGSDWSALFSEGAYRHLGWLTYALPAEDKHERSLSSGMGRSTSRRFAVTFDKESRTIRTRTDAHGRSFDPAQMNTQFEKALAEATV